MTFRWLFALALLSCSCGSRPPVTVKQLGNPVISERRERLDPKLLDDAIGGREGEPYRVGPGDTLLVAVYGHPELSMAQYAGTTLTSQGARLAGLAIDNDGSIQFPLVGSVKVAGKTVDELRQYLEQELAVYLKDPKVTVQVAFTGSIRYYLLGQFSDPGLKYSDRPLRLMEGLSLGGSVLLDKASLRTAYVARGAKRLPVDFRRLLLDGDMRENIKLRAGDIVVVPDKSSEQAFVFGGAPGSNPSGGTVQFMNGRLTLLQALAQVGFGSREHTQGHLSETFVIRSAGDRAEFIVVDAAKILAGEAAPFELEPGDVVYVPLTGLASWNEALEEILPTLQTISGLLTPFVQIKYLSQP
ncbi:MAG TPA: polysaccharide biosynthesis/export family protein [Polyangiaceae bacterium]|nr:polysaccharide biosynthesis/export family protein [Polyangiaceae bacterium]